MSLRKSPVSKGSSSPPKGKGLPDIELQLEKPEIYGQFLREYDSRLRVAEGQLFFIITEINFGENEESSGGEHRIPKNINLVNVLYAFQAQNNSPIPLRIAAYDYHDLGLELENILELSSLLNNPPDIKGEIEDIEMLGISSGWPILRLDDTEPNLVLNMLLWICNGGWKSSDARIARNYIKKLFKIDDGDMPAYSSAQELYISWHTRMGAKVRWSRAKAIKEWGSLAEDKRRIYEKKSQKLLDERKRILGDELYEYTKNLPYRIISRYTDEIENSKSVYSVFKFLIYLEYYNTYTKPIEEQERSSKIDHVNEVTTAIISRINPDSKTPYPIYTYKDGCFVQYILPSPGEEFSEIIYYDISQTTSIFDAYESLLQDYTLLFYSIKSAAPDVIKARERFQQAQTGVVNTEQVVLKSPNKNRTSARAGVTRGKTKSPQKSGRPKLIKGKKTSIDEESSAEESSNEGSSESDYSVPESELSIEDVTPRGIRNDVGEESASSESSGEETPPPRRKSPSRARSSPRRRR